MAPISLRDQLIRDEGLKLTAYQDSLGFWTIGVGRLIDARKGGGITREEAEYLLDHDIERASHAIEVLPWVAILDRARRGVLINLCFNMGIGGLLGFRKMLAAMKDGQWETAAKELLDSTYAQQVGPRAYRLAKQLETGEWV